MDKYRIVWLLRDKSEEVSRCTDPKQLRQIIDHLRITLSRINIDESTVRG